MGDGLNNQATALAVYNGDLYVGGYFTQIRNGPTVNYIARWNGSTWNAVGVGANYFVNSLAVYDGELYAGGQFTAAGGAPASRIARWNGASWSAVGGGVEHSQYQTYVFDMAVREDKLYVGGQFTTAGGDPAYNVAVWNGSTWAALGEGCNSTVHALANYHNELYVGGSFDEVDGALIYRVARWDGEQWSPVGAGANGTVYALAVYNNELYAGGWFTVAGNWPASYLARWNGVTWNAVDSGMDAYVYALLAFEGDLWVGGNFASAGPTASERVARWSQPLRAIASARDVWPPVQHHVAVTYSGGSLNMYVNGVLESTASVATGEVTATSTPLWIGRTSGPAGERRGRRVLRRPDRRAAPVADPNRLQNALRINLNKKLVGDETALVAYYRFDENAGSVTDDASPNINAGTLIGPTWVTSTAPLGDASDYTVYSEMLSYYCGWGDELVISNLTGSPPFAALIYVDDLANAAELGDGIYALFNRYYFEVWIPDIAGATYTATYHYYSGHPDITDETVLALAARADALEDGVVRHRRCAQHDVQHAHRRGSDRHAVHAG